MIVPRRLIAQTRSNASSLSSSSGLSPPPMLTPDIVVQDINAAPARPSGLNCGGERLSFGHVGGERHALATLRRHRSGLFGGGDKPVDRQDPGPFLREAERGRAAIADPLTGALAGPNDYSDLAFETHGSIPCNRCSRMPLWCLPSQVSPGVPITCLSHPLSSMRPRSRTGSVGSSMYAREPVAGAPGSSGEIGLTLPSGSLLLCSFCSAVNSHRSTAAAASSRHQVL